MSFTPPNFEWFEGAVDKAAKEVLERLSKDAHIRVEPHQRQAKEIVCIAVSEFLSNMPADVKMLWIQNARWENWGISNFLNGLRIIKDNLYERK